MVKEFRFEYADLIIDNSDIETLLGFDGQDIPDPFPKIIEQAFAEAAQLCQITCGFKIFTDIEIIKKEGLIRICDQHFHPAKIITKQFKEACSLALFICTAGGAISAKSKEEIENGDPMLGFVLDTIGSVVVDKTADKLQKMLEMEVNKLHLNISDRFSPGYCNWSVAEQQKLFFLLPKNFCGVSLSESSLMSPIKSVSGIIAIGKNLEQKGYQCNWCTDTHCIYGKIKRKKISEKKSRKTVG